MDFETPAEQSSDAAATAGSEAAPAAPAKDEAASMSALASEAQDSKQEPERPKPDAGPKMPPIPSSAMVIMPPSMRRFDAKDDAVGPKSKRPRRGRWLGYGSWAALIIVLCGAAFAAASHFFAPPPPVLQAADPATPSWQVAKDDSADMRGTASALKQELHTIEARLDSMHAVQSPEDIRALRKSIDGLKASLDAEKAEATTSIAQLSAKLDQLQRAEPAKLTQASLEKSERAGAKPISDKAADPKAIQATLDRVARTEKTDAMTTASIPATVPQSFDSAKAQPLAMAEPQRKPPQYLTNWVVRDVYDGIALVEGPEGAIEVMPGDPIPGAGVVRSIERRGGGWVVVTSRGLVDYARD